MPIKMLFIVLVVVSFVLFITNAGIIKYVQQTARERIEQSVDIGIVKSEYEDEASGGKVILDEARLQKEVRAAFQQAMHMNNKLETKLLVNTVLKVNLVYDAYDKPQIVTEFSSSFTLTLPGINKDIRVKRIVPYESLYN